MHTSACSSLRTVSLLGLLAAFGLLLIDPAQGWAETIRQPFDFEVAALPPHAKSPVERLGDPTIELERAPQRRKPAGVQLATLGHEMPRLIALADRELVGSMPGASTDLSG